MSTDDPVLAGGVRDHASGSRTQGLGNQLRGGQLATVLLITRMAGRLRKIALPGPLQGPRMDYRLPTW